MIWKIACYNGTVWRAEGQMPLLEALVKFKDCGYTEWDIKLIENLH